MRVDRMRQCTCARLFFHVIVNHDKEQSFPQRSHWLTPPTDLPQNWVDPKQSWCARAGPIRSYRRLSLCALFRFFRQPICFGVHETGAGAGGDDARSHPIGRRVLPRGAKNTTRSIRSGRKAGVAGRVDRRGTGSKYECLACIEEVWTGRRRSGGTPVRRRGGRWTSRRARTRPRTPPHRARGCRGGTRRSRADAGAGAMCASVVRSPGRMAAAAGRAAAADGSPGARSTRPAALLWKRERSFEGSIACTTLSRADADCVLHQPRGAPPRVWREVA